MFQIKVVHLDEVVYISLCNKITVLCETLLQCAHIMQHALVAGSTTTTIISCHHISKRHFKPAFEFFNFGYYDWIVSMQNGDHGQEYISV